MVTDPAQSDAARTLTEADGAHGGREPAASPIRGAATRHALLDDPPHAREGAPGEDSTGEILRLWRIATPIWAALCLLELATVGIRRLAVGGAFWPTAQSAWFTSLGYGLWVMMTPGIIWLAQRYPLSGRRATLHLAFHVPFACVFVTAHGVTYLTMRMPPPANLPFVEHMAIFFRQSFHFGLICYALILVACQIAASERQLRARELQAAWAEAARVQAELSTLRVQLQPHFLFNTLNGISSLMEEDVGAAREMMLRLSDLLRDTLAEPTVEEVSLGEELQITRRFVDLQLMRFGERLRVTYDIDPAALLYPVPRLLLQPLVENAIRFGADMRSSPSHVGICAMLLPNALRLTVVDDGVGPRSHAAVSTGLGLSITRTRLEKLYGPGATVTLEGGTQGGAIATVSIPFERWEVHE
jgi:hypothetical protein